MGLGSGGEADLLKKTPTAEKRTPLEGATAGVLGVIRSTVAFHLRKVYATLEVHSKSEAVAKAVRDGLVR